MEPIAKSCGHCRAPFTVERTGRGKQRQLYCSRRCNKAAAWKRKHDRQLPLCSVEGCNIPANRINAKLCEKHHARLRRTGQLDLKAGAKYPSREGYYHMPAPGHPLALNGMAYQHRVVLFDLIGPGKHPCRWCERLVCWEEKRGPEKLVVDHLNGVRHDNRPANLVPSCHPCNVTRGAYLRWLADHQGDYFALARHAGPPLA